jgi:hypothetical protein
VHIDSVRETDVPHDWRFLRELLRQSTVVSHLSYNDAHARVYDGSHAGLSMSLSACLCWPYRVQGRNYSDR